MKLKISGHSAGEVERVCMLDEKSLEKLIKNYNVPEHELVNMGLIKPKTKTLCIRVTKAEHATIYNISMESTINNTMSDFIREYILDMIRFQKIDVEGVKKLKNKKICKAKESHISVKVDAKIAMEFIKLCKYNHVKQAAVLRFIVRTINRKEGGKKK